MIGHPPRRHGTVFTGRGGGVSVFPYAELNLGSHVGDERDAVRRNRDILADTLAEILAAHAGEDTTPPHQPPVLVFMDQIHSATVTTVTVENINAAYLPHPAANHREITLPQTDGIVTRLPHVALICLTADCVPVLLADDTHGVIAAVHAGRAGARQGIVPQALAAMTEMGATPETITAYLGPAASGANYELPDQLADETEAQLPGCRCTTLRGTAGVDLRLGIARQLRKSGVTDITISPVCTIADERFFSFRRAQGPTGRQASVVWLDE